MTIIEEKVSDELSKITSFMAAESVGIIGIVSVFTGCWLQFGLGVALIVNGSLFVATAVVSAFRGR